MKEISAREVEMLKDKFFDGLELSDKYIRRFNDYSTLLSMYMTQTATQAATEQFSKLIQEHTKEA